MVPEDRASRAVPDARREGRQAFFSGGEPSSDRESAESAGARGIEQPTVAEGRTSGPAEGRRAFFSGAPVRALPDRRGGKSAVTVICRACGTRRSLGLGHFALDLLPSLWVPVGRWTKYMRCPSCHRFTWSRVEW